MQEQLSVILLIYSSFFSISLLCTIRLRTRPYSVQSFCKRYLCTQEWHEARTLLHLVSTRPCIFSVDDIGVRGKSVLIALSPFDASLLREHLKQQLDHWTEGYVTHFASAESRLPPTEQSEAETCSSRSSIHSSKPDWHRFETTESAQEFLQPAANYVPPPAGLPERPATQDHQTSSKATQQHHATLHPTTMKRGDNSVKQKLLYTAW